MERRFGAQLSSRISAWGPTFAGCSSALVRRLLVRWGALLQPAVMGRRRLPYLVPPIAAR